MTKNSLKLTKKNKLPFKPSIFFSNYKKKIRTSITNNCKQLDNIQLLIPLFPFVFSFSLLIQSRYKEQFFSYFVKETLPGFCLPHQNMSWETFNEITSQKIVSTQNFEQYSSGKKKQTHFYNTPNNKTGFVASTLPNIMTNVNSTNKNKVFVCPDLLERLDIYSNLILLEMKPAWEEQQKQLYIDFLPKKKEITLKKLPVFLTSPPNISDISKGDVSEAVGDVALTSDISEGDVRRDVREMSNSYKAKNGTSAFSDLTNPLFLTQKQKITETNLPSIKDERFTSQTKNNESESFYRSKLYADTSSGDVRKPSFLSFSKNKVSLEKKSIDQRVKVNNVFSKQYFQQKFVDLDELPLKLDQNYSIDSDKTYLLNTLFNYDAKENLPNLSNVKEMKDTFSLLSTRKDQQFYNTLTDLHPRHSKGMLKAMLEANPLGYQVMVRTTQDGDVKNNQTDLILPSKSEVSSRFLSGYRFPDTERVEIGSLFIQNVYKDIIFQKANKKNLKIIIQVPSSFVYDFLNENDSHLTSPPNISKGDVALTSRRDVWGMLESMSDQQNPKNILFSQKTKKENLLPIETPNTTNGDDFSCQHRLLHPLGCQVQAEESVTQLNFNYLPGSQTFLNKVLIEKSNIGGIYQKVFTIYKADQTVRSLTSDISKGYLSAPFLTPPSNITFGDVKPEGYVKILLTPLLALSKSSTILRAQSFRESWEPVTFQSWLAITKLSFAFFVLKFLQYFYTNYGRDLLIVVLRFLDENLKEGLGLTDKKKNKGYRLIKKVKKAFKDVAGIDNILPELGEMVWVLRNSGNGCGANKSFAFVSAPKTTFKFGNLLPKGFLFVGPPGTGKTFLVQAIAGEAGVPVLVQSGSSLTGAGENEKGAQPLKNLFEEARQLAPCIVFIDEIDTLGKSRQNVMRNSDAQQGTDDLIQSLHKYNQSSSAKQIPLGATSPNKSNINVSEKFQDTQKNQDGNQEKQKGDQEQLNLLMQLLIELDGLKYRKGVIVIGATNRPKVLDPALTRPGRFDRVLNLEFPGKKKRIEILKLYSQNIGLADTLTHKPKVMLENDVKMTEGGVKSSVSLLTSPTNITKGDFKMSDKAFSSFTKESLPSTDTNKKNVKANKFSAAELTSQKDVSESTNQLDSFFNPLKSLPHKEEKEIGKSSLQTSNLAKPKNKKFFSKNQSRLRSLPFNILMLNILTGQKTRFFVRPSNITKGDVKILERYVKKVMLKEDVKSGVKEGMSKSTKLQFPWEYLANLTFGFSAADLAAAMNQSSIQAILRKTGHTIETIEQGIESITSYSIEKPKIESEKSQDLSNIPNIRQRCQTNKETFYCLTSDLNSKGVLVKESKTFLQTPSLLLDVRLPKVLSFQKSKEKKDPFFLTRVAYYQAGKGVLHTLLPEHPDVILLKLWPQPKNSRHKDANFQLTSIDHRAKLETRLIGLYAGKAAELLFLCINSHIKKENLLLSLLGTEKTDSIASSVYTKQPDISKGDVKRGFASNIALSDVKQKQNWKKTLNDGRWQIKKKLNEKVDFSSYEKRNLWHSNLGIDELSIASNLAHSLVDKWFFYSNKITLRKENQIFTNQNTLEFSKIELVDLFQQLTEEVQKLVSASNISESSMRDGRDKHFRSNFQEWSIRPWWQNQITKEIGNLNMFYDDWYRIYLPDPQESERNEEWVIPDEYYHNTQNLKNILPFFGYKAGAPKKQSNQGYFDHGFNKNESYGANKSFAFVKAPKTPLLTPLKEMSGVTKDFQTKNELYVDITWNDLYKIDRDYIYHALIITCFNKAFSLLDENRELLDYLSDYLMRFETLRQHKIKEIFCDFGDFSLTSLCSSSFTQEGHSKGLTKTKFLSVKMLESDVRSNSPKEMSGADTKSNIKKNILKEKQKIKFVFDKKWGINSRRNLSTFFNFDLLTKLIM